MQNSQVESESSYLKVVLVHSFPGNHRIVRLSRERQKFLLEKATK